MQHPRLRSALALWAIGCTPVLVQCATPSESPTPHHLTPQQLESTTIALRNVPTGVACVRIDVNKNDGTAAQVDTPVTGTRNVIDLGPLPFGSATLTGGAFSVPCESVAVGAEPSYRAGPRTIQIAPDGPREFDLVFSTTSDTLVTPVFRVGAVSLHLPGFGINAAGKIYGSSDRNTQRVAPYNALGAAQAYRSQIMLNENGDLYCAGSNFGGECGVAKAQPQPESPKAWSDTIATPTRVPLPVPISSFDAGDYESRIAVGTNGMLYRWGSATLYYRGRATEMAPYVVNGMSNVRDAKLGSASIDMCVLNGWKDVYCAASAAFRADVTWRHVAGAVSKIAMGSHALILLRTDGTVWTLGNVYASESVDGTTTVQKLSALPGTIRFVDIATSSEAACALGHEGSLYCWGRGDQTGTGSLEEGALIAPTKVLGFPAKAIALWGHRRSPGMCSEHTDGTYYCWGSLEGRRELNTLDDGFSGPISAPTASRW